MLGAVTPERLDELAEDQDFLRRLDRLSADLRDYLTRPMWFQELQINSSGGPYKSSRSPKWRPCKNWEFRMKSSPQ